MALAKSLYRSLLRKASELRSRNCHLLLREPMDVRRWGQGRFVRHDPAAVLEECFDFELPQTAAAALVGHWTSSKRPVSELGSAGSDDPNPAPETQAPPPLAVSHDADVSHGDPGASDGDDGTTTQGADRHATPATATAATATAGADTANVADTGDEASNPATSPATAAASTTNGELVPAAAVVRAVRAAARFYEARCRAGVLDDTEAVSKGFSALRSLGALVEQSLSTSVTTTKGVRVEVTTQQISKTQEEYVENPNHVFCYRVRVHNDLSNPKAQLVGRHLIFTDSNGHVEEVPRGSVGVVGHTPVLEPGQSFEYYSGVYTPTSTGTVVGSFQMVQMGPGRERKHFDVHLGPATFHGTGVPSDGAR